LIAETDARVVLLEMGGEYRGPLLKLSPGFSKLVPKGIHCTIHRTVAQDCLDNRVLEIATGRVLGGGSSVNAQVYMRGYRSDYDQMGCGRRERPVELGRSAAPFPVTGRESEAQRGLSRSDGPLQVADPGFICEYSHLYVKAAQSFGLPFTADFNGGSACGHRVTCSLRPWAAVSISWNASPCPWNWAA
jgi:choline dehydrogenase-like flavoprotein